MDVRCAGRVELATVCVGVVWRYCLTVSQPCMRAALRVRERAEAPPAAGRRRRPRSSAVGLRRRSVGTSHNNNASVNTALPRARVSAAVAPSLARRGHTESPSLAREASDSRPHARISHACAGCIRLAASALPHTIAVTCWTANAHTSCAHHISHPHSSHAASTASEPSSTLRPACISSPPNRARDVAPLIALPPPLPPLRLSFRHRSFASYNHRDRAHTLTPRARPSPTPQSASCRRLCRSFGVARRSPRGSGGNVHNIPIRLYSSAPHATSMLSRVIAVLSRHISLHANSSRGELSMVSILGAPACA